MIAAASHRLHLDPLLLSRIQNQIKTEVMKQLSG
jgi:hypothetical protein